MMLEFIYCSSIRKNMHMQKSKIWWSFFSIVDMLYFVDHHWIDHNRAQAVFVGEPQRGEYLLNLSRLPKMIHQWICKVSFESMCFCCLDSHTPLKLNMEPENDYTPTHGEPPMTNLCTVITDYIFCSRFFQVTFLIPFGCFKIFTPLKFNMEPQKKCLEKEIPFGNHHFQVSC